MRTRILLALLGLAALAGCGSTGTGLEATGGGTVPSARISFDLGRDASTPAPSDPHAGTAIELGYSRGNTRGSQNLPNGATSSVNGQDFIGPLTLQNEAEMEFVDVLWRGRAFTQNGVLGGEFLIGLSNASMDYVVSAPGQRATDGVSEFGGTLGVGAIVRLRRGTSVQARYSWFGSAALWSDTDARRFDVSLVQAIGRHLMLRAGYASWQFSTNANNGSKLNAHLSGPTLGLELGF